MEKRGVKLRIEGRGAVWPRGRAVVCKTTTKVSEVRVLLLPSGEGTG